MEMKEKIKAFIKENFIITEDVEIGDDDDIFQKGFVNSLFAMKLLNFIESECNITIDNEDIEISNFNTLNHIMRIVNKKLDIQ